jgi:hypothetical protein
LRKALYLILLCWIVLPVVSGQDFSGIWKLRSAHQELGSLPESPAATLEIDHRSGTIRCTSSVAGRAPLVFDFTTDGKEKRTKSGATSLISVAKWEGSALLVNTIVNSPSGAYTQMDRWTISRDGTTLSIGREVVRATGRAEATLIYGKPGLATKVLPATPVPMTTPPALRQAELSNNPGDTPARVLKPNVPSNPPGVSPDSVKPAPQPQRPALYAVKPGTQIPLVLINSVSTKQSAEGDRVYLATTFPVLVDGRIVIPPGSYVAGTLTFVKRPGRVRGRGELYLRFDSLTLPNGVTRDFRSRPDALDAETKGELDRSEGNIKSEGTKGTDVRTIGETAAAGASVGAIAGSAAGRPGLGVGMGAAGGAAAGLMAVLLTRGPDLVLARGSSLEMVLDRELVFAGEDLAAGWRRTKE